MEKRKLPNLFRLELGSILLVIFGGVLLLNPDFGSAALAGILGWVLVGAGAAGLFIGFTARPMLGIGGIGSSFVTLAFGIYLLRRPLMLAKVIGLVLGLLLLTQGLGALRDALRLKRFGGSCGLSLALGIGMSALGAVLLLSPMTTSRFVMSVAGIVMVACGISNLISHRQANKFITGTRKKIIGDPDIIDADQ